MGTQVTADSVVAGRDGIVSHGVVDGRAGLRLGQQATLVAIQTGTVNLDPASIGATTTGFAVGTIAGVAVGDVVILAPPAALEDDLIPKGGARITGADTIQQEIYNASAAPVDGISRAWTYIWFDLTP